MMLYGVLLLLQGLRVYEQGRLLSAWQDRLSDSIQAQLAALFNRACSQFLQLSGVKVRPLITSQDGYWRAVPSAVASKAWLNPAL
jgi:hypothetical protein